MVNGGFPPVVEYGFKMVDGQGEMAALDINQKFTPNQMKGIFRGSFTA